MRNKEEAVGWTRVDTDYVYEIAEEGLKYIERKRDEADEKKIQERMSFGKGLWFWWRTISREEAIKCLDEAPSFVLWRACFWWEDERILRELLCLAKEAKLAGNHRVTVTSEACRVIRSYGSKIRKSRRGNSS